MAGWTRLELATFSVTVRYSNQAELPPHKLLIRKKDYIGNERIFQ